MKKLIYILILIVVGGCVKVEEEVPRGQASFSGLSVNDFLSGSPNSRQQNASEWRHVFTDYAEIQMVNLGSGEEFTLAYDPNDFEEPYAIELPLGEYEFSSVVAGGDLEDFLPFEVHGAFMLDGGRAEIQLEGFTDYGLVSVRNEFLEQAVLNHDGDSKELTRTRDRQYYYQYVRGGSNVLLEITEFFDQNVIEREIEVEEYVHYHFYLELPEVGNANSLELQLGGFEYSE